ncbi:MAG: GntR family transcriptional regulator [Micrococcaceae bacterium]
MLDQNPQEDAHPPIKGAVIADRLEEQILAGSRFPKERLVEDQLIDEFGANRYEVRKALTELISRGLAERKKNAGAFVRHYSENEVNDLYQIRTLLEGACAASIVTPVAQERLNELINRQVDHDTAVQHHDLSRVIEANLAFHRTLYRLSPNRLLVDAVEHYAKMSYIIRSAPFKSRDALEHSREEHWQMIKCLENGDTQELARICQQHLVPSQKAYLRARRGSFD